MAENAVKSGGEGSEKAPSQNKAKKSRKRKQLPQPGDPGYMTPTQLRNARKRRKKKQDKAKASSSSEGKHKTGSETSATHEGGNRSGGSNSTNDPSLKYLSNPRAAPTVRNAIKFFREKTGAKAGTNHDSYFPVALGPKLGWRTVARLAVVRSSSSSSSNSNSSKDSPRLRIGLFVPGSHELLPVPDCPVHHRRINGLVKVLEDECQQQNIPAFVDHAEGIETSPDHHLHKFGLRYIAIAIERSTKKQQLVLVWKEAQGSSGDDNDKDTGNGKNNGSNLLDALIKRLVRMSKDKNQKDIRLHSIWVHYNNTWKHSNSIFDRAGRWETKFVDGENAKSSSDPFRGAVRETMLPLAKPTKPGEADAEDSETKPGVRVPLHFPPQVFRQANLDGFAKIILRIREWLDEKRSKETPTSNKIAQENPKQDAPPKRKRRRGKKDTSNKTAASTRETLGHCLELYGGVGTIGLNLVDYFDSLDSSDENPFNKVCFEASADRIRIISSDGEEAPLDPGKRGRISYTSKSASDVVSQDFESLKRARVVVVDPPRKGLDSPVIEALCSDYGGKGGSEQQHLVYVSCGFDAFRRDYRALVEHSGVWTLDRAEGHILFPGSDAIETLAFFTRTK